MNTTRKAHTHFPQLTVWKGYFHTWYECEQAGEELNIQTGVPAAFESDRWIERQLGMYGDALLGTYPRACSLPAVVASTKATCIADFGGGSGWPLELLGDQSKNSLTSYFVIEQQRVVEAMQTAPSVAKALTFVEHATLAGEGGRRSDILYSNSAFQYLGSLRHIEDLLTCVDATWILLDDVQLSTGSEFFSLQHYYGTYIPCRFFDVEVLVELMSDLGFSCHNSWPYQKTFASGIAPVVADANDAPHRPRTPLSFLFQRAK